MFVRRLKIMLGLVIALSIVLLLRVGQVQVLQHDYWASEAGKSAAKPTVVDPPRGKIQDIKGRDLALDVACLNADVDYRAIAKDPDWIKTLARKRLARRSDYPTSTRAQRAQMLAQEIALIGTQIDAMWPALARVSGKSLDEIEEIRQSIVQRVELRRRLAWYNLYQRAIDKQQSLKGPSPWYKRWLIDPTQVGADLDSSRVTVGDEIQPHIVLRDISNDIGAELSKNLEEYPGLVMQDDAHRHYTEPASTSACFILGHLSNVTAEDLKDDPNVGDELQQYLPNDLIGRDGIEKLAEPMLRGSKGRQVHYLGQSEPVDVVAPVPGQDVRLTIDIDLQTEIQQILQRVKVRDGETGRLIERTELHGAAVLIDVPTGEVRALVSNPGFDLNRWDADWPKLREDEINRPTLNRATMAQFPPGSSVKPIVGCTGVTRGFIGVTDTIHCTGYLVIDGRKQQNGRCWTASQFEKKYPQLVANHQIPTEAPHPTGFLTLPDALQRSCNVYFQTLADRMGLNELDAGFRNFGLGSATGIGIAEARGHLPDPRFIPPALLRSSTWPAGIGQGLVLATPIQMANVAATLARGGVWIRPHLLISGPQGIADRRDLGIAPDALAAVKEGMMLVVNSPAGTGTECNIKDTGMIVAAKTGSAQAGKFSAAAHDSDGHIIKGAPRTVYEPGAFPWYQGFGEDHTHLSHAWYIGYAPADQPKMAFAVMIEYGGSGGLVAGCVARDMLAACVEHGYLDRGAKLSP